jgi:hypothetical protein
VLGIEEEFIHDERTCINFNDLQRVLSKLCPFSLDKSVHTERVRPQGFGDFSAQLYEKRSINKVAHILVMKRLCD